MVDAAIYSEMKGGIHPWFTGLAVVGGVYVFGVVGAVYGPLALCVLYVLVSLYTSFMQVRYRHHVRYCVRYTVRYRYIVRNLYAEVHCTNTMYCLLSVIL